MHCIDEFRKYVFTREFACEEHLSCWGAFDNPAYQFNFMELAGNALLSPMEWVFIKLEDTHNCVVQIALITTGVFVAIIALPGAALKEIGQMVNPHSTLRQDAFVKVLEFQKIAIDGLSGVFESSVDICKLLSDRLFTNKGLEIDLLFKNKILKEKHHATDHEIAFLYKKDRTTENKDLAIASIKSLEPTSLLEKLDRLFTEWANAWESFTLKLINNKDYSREEAIIRGLASEDEETAQKTGEHLDAVKKPYEITAANHNLLAKMEKARSEYNQIRAQITN